MDLGTPEKRATSSTLKVRLSMYWLSFWFSPMGVYLYPRPSTATLKASSS